MKSVCISLLAVFLSTTTFAADELARYERNAGFSPRSGSEALTIDTEGRVEFNSEYFDRRSGRYEIRRVEVARLDRGLINGLRASLRQIHARDLRDEQEGQPRCTDAPSYWFSVVKNGEAIRIGGQEGCHHFVNETAVARQIRSVLEGLAALAQF